MQTSTQPQKEKTQPRITLCTKEDHLAMEIANEMKAYIFPEDCPDGGLRLQIESVDQKEKYIKKFSKKLTLTLIRFTNHEKVLRLLPVKLLHDLAERFGDESDDWIGQEFILFNDRKGFFNVSFPTDTPIVELS